eukprot:CAMPEP_0206516542 /NCGR_PEP_ID=MMETSP0324_2-20121206/63429_1 /ASSEMBLY_ACC=CAM_ASM_000836 /TAXON_ID=2866 /ORGANISM="Crypthecodinium cohnii, Strain Seligo" /LENGTH=44 /DNA_ID= /DNA_START= /DNA_END= /DNA_ORIENTATION=
MNPGDVEALQYRSTPLQVYGPWDGRGLVAQRAETSTVALTAIPR